MTARPWHWPLGGASQREKCAGGLKVLDISPGQDLLPATAPGLPALALDSPGMSPILKGRTVRFGLPSREGGNVNFRCRRRL